MHEEHANADPAFEYSRIDDHVTIGTNACCQAHFSEKLLKDGVTADISLEGEMLDHPAGVSTYLWLPTPDHQPPSRGNVDVGTAALKRMLGNGQRVYIHCKNGHGRGPTFYAAYLVLERGMSPDEAVALIKEKRPSVHLEESQVAFLRNLTKA